MRLRIGVEQPYLVKPSGKKVQEVLMVVYTRGEMRCQQKKMQISETSSEIQLKLEFIVQVHQYLESVICREMFGSGHHQSIGNTPTTRTTGAKMRIHGVQEWSVVEII